MVNCSEEGSIKHDPLQFRESAVRCKAVSRIDVNYTLGANGKGSLICPRGRRIVCELRW